jgi:Contractile injection system tape measure protein
LADQKFAIQKQIFEIGAFSKEQVHELQNRISRLVNHSLIKKTENYFNEVIPADLLLRMDQLVLDIGEVKLDSMEEEIEQRFMDALEYEFTQRLEFLKNDKTRPLSGISIETTGNGKLELFEYFLLYGVLPWYADTTVKFDIDGLLDELYTTNRSALRSIIQKAGKDLNVRLRMSYQFSDRTIKQIINIIEPAEAEYIFQTQKELINVQHEKQIVQQEEKDFRKTVWLFILNYLLAEMGSKFEKKMFIKSNLTQIAAHYNISYLQLLHSFYDVMKTLHQTEIFQPLKSVIYELFTDETEAPSKNKILKRTDTTAETDILTLSSKIELLQYYFYTGSLPDAYEKMGRDDLKQLLLSMVNLAPAAMGKLLLSLRNQPKGIYNLYQLIDASESEAFVKLIHRDNESEIENIMILFSILQQEKPFSHATGSDFKNEVWKYLLDHFLFTGQTVYEGTTVIGYLVKRFASAMNYTESGLVTILKNSLQRTIMPDHENTGLAIALKEVLLDIEKTTTVNFADHYKEEPLEDENILSVDYTTGQLSAVIRYILQYGAVPWWGHAFYRFSLDELMTRLHQKDAAAMLVLFRKAIVIPVMKARLITDIPAGILRNLMHELPGGAEVVMHIDEFLAILDGSKLVRYHAPEFVQKTIFTIAWEIHSRSGYALFPGILFYHETIKRFSVLLKLEPKILISTLIQPQEKKISVLAGNTKNLLQALFDHFEEQRTEQPTGTQGIDTKTDIVLEEEENKQEHTEILSLLNKSETIQQHFDFTNRSAGTVVPELIDVLQYFLYWNHLPDNLSFLEKDEQKKLLRQILMILFLQSPVALRALIEDKANVVTARAYLNELFLITEGGKEKRMAEFLFEIILPLPDITTDQTPTENYFTEQDNTGFDLVKLLRKETAIADTATKDKVLEESKRVLSYFLKYNCLPDDLATTGKVSMERLLKEIILFLFRQQKNFIYELFKDTNTSTTARLYLYDLLAVSYDIETNQVKVFMQDIREADLDNMFLQISKGEDAGFEKDPSALITKILQNATSVIKQEYHSFLSSASFAKRIMDRSGVAALLQLAAFKINWPFTSDTVIQGWLEFLQKAIPPGLNKEKIMELFNQFNIIFISGRLNIYSNDSYTIALINFLSGQLGTQAGEIFRQLFDRTLRSAKNPAAGIINQYNLMQRMLRPVIAVQEELRTVQAAIKAAEEKKLSVILKQEIAAYRQQLAESLKKETLKNTDTMPADEAHTDNTFKPETGESIYIANAGLVLFHPFLETYFSRTGLMENNAFIDNNCRNRAVLLLQYLATGNTEHAEHELVLNKIMCNVPLEEAIPVSFTATETEADVSRELLEVVIERWDKMKNTSPEGFQNSFIMRDGMLNFREDHWNLKVEQRGYDVLLQTLPWAFGYIKMSWMQHNLIVEWI